MVVEFFGWILPIDFKANLEVDLFRPTCFERIGI